MGLAASQLQSNTYYVSDNGLKYLYILSAFTSYVMMVTAAYLETANPVWLQTEFIGVLEDTTEWNQIDSLPDGIPAYS